MSAPVNFLFFSLGNEKAPTSRSGALAIYFRCLLARARPRSDNAKKAKESKEAYVDAAGAHVFVNPNA